jgi:hypothetical protein
MLVSCDVAEVSAARTPFDIRVRRAWRLEAGTSSISMKTSCRCNTACTVMFILLKMSEMTDILRRHPSVQ